MNECLRHLTAHFEWSPTQPRIWKISQSKSTSFENETEILMGQLYFFQEENVNLVFPLSLFFFCF